MALSAPIPAQAQQFSATRIISQFNYPTLRAVVIEMGGTIKEGNNGGWLISFSNGTAATAYFTVCEDDDESSCLGTNLLARFGKPSDKSVTETNALVEDFNKRFNAAKAFPLEDGRSAVQAYIIADGGLTMENYRMQLTVYADLLKKMRETIYTDG